MDLVEPWRFIACPFPNESISMPWFHPARVLAVQKEIYNSQVATMDVFLRKFAIINPWIAIGCWLECGLERYSTCVEGGGVSRIFVPNIWAKTWSCITCKNCSRLAIHIATWPAHRWIQRWSPGIIWVFGTRAVHDICGSQNLRPLQVRGLSIGRCFWWLGVELRFGFVSRFLPHVNNRFCRYSRIPCPHCKTVSPLRNVPPVKQETCSWKMLAKISHWGDPTVWDPLFPHCFSAKRKE